MNESIYIQLKPKRDLQTKRIPQNILSSIIRAYETRNLARDFVLSWTLALFLKKKADVHLALRNQHALDTSYQEWNTEKMISSWIANIASVQIYNIAVTLSFFDFISLNAHINANLLQTI